MAPLYTFSQANKSTYRVYDLNMLRFKAKYMTSFALGIAQGQIDEDSAATMACSLEALPHRLLYDEVYDIEGNAPGHELIDNNRIKDAVALLSQLTGERRIKMLLQLASYYIYKPGTSSIHLDSANRFAQQALNESSTQHLPGLTNAAFQVLAKLNFEKGDTLLTRRYQDVMLKNARNAGKPFDLAQALTFKAASTPFFDAARIKDLTEALSIYRTLKDTTHAILAENSIFNVYFVMGMLDTVADELRRTMALETAMGFREIHYDLSVIAYVDEMMNRHAEAFINNNLAVKLMEAQHDTAFSSFFYGKTADLLMYYNDLEESIKWYNKSFPPRNDRYRLWYANFISEANCMLNLDRYKNAIALIRSIIHKYPPLNPLEGVKIYTMLSLGYMQLEDYSTSRAVLDTAANYVQQIKDLPETRYTVAYFYTQDATLRINTGDIKGAKAAVQTSWNYINPLRGAASPLAEQCFRVAYKIDSANGDMTSALANYKRMQRMADSAFNDRKTRQLEELKIKFDISQKDKDLELLQNESQLQQDLLHKETLTRNLVIGGLVMLTILLGLLYNRFRLKQKQQTEISGKNKALEKLLTEKEWLIKEIHHRVKNNLQMVVSLLSAQSAHLNNKEARHAIRESEQRMHAMSLIHQKLYQSETMEHIEMSGYIKELTGYLGAHTGGSGGVRFALNLQPVKLDVAQAVPLGLILNEAITNALKYAFPDHRAGTISITLQHDEEQQLELRISDNGKGLPPGFDAAGSTSLGITLMKGLVQQLKGSFALHDQHGVTITVCFPYNFFTAEETAANVQASA